MTVRIRHLSLHEVLLRQRERSTQEVARHNAHVVEELQLVRVRPLRDQVLREFSPRARSLAQ